MLIMSRYLPLIFLAVVGLILVARTANSGPLDAVDPPKIDAPSPPTPDMPDVPNNEFPDIGMPDMPNMPDMPDMSDTPGMDGLNDTIEYMKMVKRIMDVFKKINEFLGKMGISLPTPDLDTIKYIAKLG